MNMHEPYLSVEEDLFAPLPQGEICYRSYGPETGEPLVLLGGLGVQLIYWPAALLNALVEQGHRVITPDNRDIGRSFRHASRPPGMKQIMFRKPVPGYSLSDMAQDVVGLLDHLSIEKAHVAGMSMGGMIAQTVAAEHPARVKSLTSIFSTTGSRKVGQPSLQGKLRLVKKRARTREEDTERYSQTMDFISGDRFKPEDAVMRAYAGAAWDRGNGPKAGAGIARQINAIYTSGNREAQVAQITAPTLVIHGDKDPLVNPSGGVATARLIKDSQHVVIHGMGHCISDSVSPLLADLVAGHCRRAALSCA